MIRNISILGSTGSVGRSTLDVIGAHPGKFRVCALTANSNHELLLDQCRRFKPGLAVLIDQQAADSLGESLRREGIATEVACGAQALIEAATREQADCVMAAIVGAAGLAPTLAAATAGKTILLANKESLVLAGHLLMTSVERHGARLIPIDSEHNAIFQCLPMVGSRPDLSHVKKLILTASGGPLLNTPVNELISITPEQACAHPNWDMGDKISVDSATMMNKGLELIEACYLFGVTPDQVEVVIHPQSIVHSMVEYRDGSVLAQLGNPDMRTPIAHALAWPERINSGVRSLDLVEIGRLDFLQPDLGRFRCLALARQAAEAGGTAPAVLNAANEIAVAAFLHRRLSFSGIADVIAERMECHVPAAVKSLDDLLAVDSQARADTTSAIERMSIAV